MKSFYNTRKQRGFFTAAIALVVIAVFGVPAAAVVSTAQEDERAVQAESPAGPTLASTQSNQE